MLWRLVFRAQARRCPRQPQALLTSRVHWIDLAIASALKRCAVRGAEPVVDHVRIMQEAGEYDAEFKWVEKILAGSCTGRFGQRCLMLSRHGRLQEQADAGRTGAGAGKTVSGTSVASTVSESFLADLLGSAGITLYCCLALAVCLVSALLRRRDCKRGIAHRIGWR
jgi:hypothetical protein